MGKNDIPRVRRRKETLENDIDSAALKLIEKDGFSKLTVGKLIKEANIEPAVFYNRYNNIDDFIDKFVRIYDYWLNDSIKVDLKKGNAVDNIIEIVINLIDSIYDNTCMQKLIAWEINERNYITVRTAQNRDTNSASLIKYFEEEFKGCNIDFNTTLAIIIGGIYYLVIHRELATFNNIDFSTEEAKVSLKNSITKILMKLFDDYNGEKAKHHSPADTAIDLDK